MTRLSPVPPRAQNFAIPQDRPVFRIKQGKFFGPDDTLYEEGSFIVWKDEPNLEMEPMNELAQDSMLAFLEKLDAAGREVAKKTGKNWSSLADAHANAYSLAQQESKSFEVLNAPKQVPLMGAKKNVTSIEEIQINQAPPLMGTTKGRLSLGAKNTEGK